MRSKLTLALALALAAHAAVPGHAAGQGYTLVVNTTNPTSSLSRAEVARLFLKKVTSWPDGRSVVAIDQERTAEVRQAFSAEVHQKDADAVSAYWQTLVFSGRAVPPRILRGDAEVLEFVRANPGAIGYVSKGAPLSGVKAVGVR